MTIVGQAQKDLNTAYQNIGNLLTEIDELKQIIWKKEDELVIVKKAFEDSNIQNITLSSENRRMKSTINEIISMLNNVNETLR